MEFIRPIMPNFDKCREKYGWNSVTTFNIASSLNDVYELKSKSALRRIRGNNS